MAELGSVDQNKLYTEKMLDAFGRGAIDLENTDLDYDEIINFFGKDYLDHLSKDCDRPAIAAHDSVHAPSHYNQGGIECIDALKASMSDEEFLGYLRGNSFKYLWRCNHKGKTTEDLKKSRWYLDRLIAEHER